jgi:subtilisin family serine protease/fibronectin type 3 domain-containing protein
MRPVGGIRTSTGLVILVLAASLVAPAAAYAETPPPFPQGGTDVLARDSWIVTLKASANPRTDAARLARKAGGSVGNVYSHAFKGFQLKGSAKAAAALRRNPQVRSVTQDRPVYLTETDPYGIERIDAFIVGGGDAYEAGYRGAGARIAVIDTGIDIDHPDLAASIDTDAGWNCVNEALPPNDGHGHGTHVSGTAAAPLNGEGVVGVAPEATLVPIKTFDDAGNSSEALVLCGLDRVVALNTDADPANDIDVANMSWGDPRAWGSCADDELHGAICAADAAGVVLVGGSGNNSADAGTFVPAAFPEVVSVSALSDFDGKPGGLGGCQFVASLFWFECDDSLAFFSNYGPSVDVIAPGVNVYSSWAAGTYQVQNGTSMATPHVTGVVALMRSVDPALTPAAARDALLASGECPDGTWADADASPGCTGQGTWADDPDGIAEVLPNALRAAQLVAGGEPPPPPPPPEPTAPGAPTLTSATAGVDRITLGWNAPPSDGGSPLTGYQVWRGTASGAESLLATVGVQQSYVDLAVAAGTTYWYQVAAVNDIGAGPRSNERSASLIRPASAPTLLGAPADGMAILSWTVPADDGGSAITGYNVYRKVGSAAESLLGTAGATETTWIDAGLTNGTGYTYRVSALNGAGEGAFSNAVTVVPTGSATAPSAPLDLRVVKGRSSLAVNLAWSAPSSDGGSQIATYVVYRRGPGETGFSPIATTAFGTTTFSDGTVARRSTYAYYVTALNAYGQSPPSNEVSVRTK